MTVAILKNKTLKEFKLNEKDLKIEWFGGTVKAGGQHRNKHANSCRLTHIPSGVCETRQGRKRNTNLREAREALIKRLSSSENEKTIIQTSKERSKKVGSGQRGDKIITIRLQDDVVINHLNNKKTSSRKFMKGDFGLIL